MSRVERDDQGNVRKAICPHIAIQEAELRRMREELEAHHANAADMGRSRDAAWARCGELETQNDRLRAEVERLHLRLAKAENERLREDLEG